MISQAVGRLPKIDPAILVRRVSRDGSPCITAVARLANASVIFCAILDSVPLLYAT